MEQAAHQAMSMGQWHLQGMWSTLMKSGLGIEAEAAAQDTPVLIQQIHPAPHQAIALSWSQPTPAPPFPFPSQHSHRLCPSPLVTIPWQSDTHRAAGAGAASCTEHPHNGTAVSQNSFSMLGLGRLPKAQGSPKDESAITGIKYPVLVNIPF